MDYERIVRSLEQSVYNRNLINNAERGAYVEHMIVLALEGQGWDLTWPWASWDLQHRDGARIATTATASPPAGAGAQRFAVEVAETTARRHITGMMAMNIPDPALSGRRLASGIVLVRCRTGIAAGTLLHERGDLQRNPRPTGDRRGQGRQTGAENPRPSGRRTRRARMDRRVRPRHRRDRVEAARTRTQNPSRHGLHPRVAPDRFRTDDFWGFFAARAEMLLRRIETATGKKIHPGTGTVRRRPCGVRKLRRRAGAVGSRTGRGHRVLTRAAWTGAGR